MFKTNGLHIDSTGRPSKDASLRVLVVPSPTRKSEVQDVVDFRERECDPKRVTRYWWRERQKYLASCGHQTGIVFPANLTAEGVASIFAHVDYQNKGGLTRPQLRHFFTTTGLHISKAESEALHDEMVKAHPGVCNHDKPRVTLDMILDRVHIQDVLPSPTKHGKQPSPKYNREKRETPLTQALVQLARSWATDDAQAAADTPKLKLPTLGNIRGRRRGDLRQRGSTRGSNISRAHSEPIFPINEAVRGAIQRSHFRRSARRPRTTLHTTRGYRTRRARQKIRDPNSTKDRTKLPSLQKGNDNNPTWQKQW